MSAAPGGRRVQDASVGEPAARLGSGNGGGAITPELAAPKAMEGRMSAAPMRPVDEVVASRIAEEQADATDANAMALNLVDASELLKGVDIDVESKAPQPYDPTPAPDHALPGAVQQRLRRTFDEGVSAAGGQQRQLRPESDARELAASVTTAWQQRQSEQATAENESADDVAAMFAAQRDAALDLISRTEGEGMAVEADALPNQKPSDTSNIQLLAADIDVMRLAAAPARVQRGGTLAAAGAIDDGLEEVARATAKAAATAGAIHSGAPAGREPVRSAVLKTEASALLQPALAAAAEWAQPAADDEYGEPEAAQAPATQRFRHQNLSSATAADVVGGIEADAAALGSGEMAAVTVASVLGSYVSAGDVRTAQSRGEVESVDASQRTAVSASSAGVAPAAAATAAAAAAPPPSTAEELLREIDAAAAFSQPGTGVYAPLQQSTVGGTGGAAASQPPWETGTAAAAASKTAADIAGAAAAASEAATFAPAPPIIAYPGIAAAIDVHEFAAKGGGRRGAASSPAGAASATVTDPDELLAAATEESVEPALRPSHHHHARGAGWAPTLADKSGGGGGGRRRAPDDWEQSAT